MNLNKFQVDSLKENGVTLGKNDLGSVHIHGPLGNPSSEVKIAFLIGMHPLESQSHRALFDTLTSKKDLNYSYYIYNISVNDLENEGRKNGQLLAYEFVRPDIIDREYDLFLDIHSNRGINGYEISNFIFAPGFDVKSEKLVNELLLKIPQISFYIPEIRTSPAYITQPAAEAGIATIIYETYTYEPIETTYNLASKLVESVDSLKL